MIRVLIADASPGARRLLLDAFSADPEIVVIGEAGDGSGVIALTRQLRPDVVVMDIDMPSMNGFGVTKQIMIEMPTPIVIVSAAPSERQVELSMLALRAGALTVLPKLAGPASGAEREERQRFVAAIKAMAQVKVVRHWPARESGERQRPMPETMPRTHRKIVAIAASTGGPAAIQSLLSQLPTDFPAPILVVQHIATGFIPGFTVWLNTVCSLRVKVAESGEMLAARTVYVAPDSRHLGLASNWTVQLSEAPPIGGFRPSATFLFQSVAQVAGRAVLAVILTGMGRDGVDGLSFVRSRGGFVIAQDEATSVVFGMPAAAIAANQVDAVLSLPAIAPRLQEMV
jgi:two-component system, chemotaxis family, protein-glutamate methylesterase/glutaminase